MNLAHAFAGDNTDDPIFSTPERPPLEMLPTDHVRVLHPSGPERSNVRVCRAQGTWKEKTVPIKDLERYAASLGSERDLYITQNAFFGRRKTCNLAELHAHYVDLDYHHTVRWNGESAQTVTNAVLIRLEDREMPIPSYIVSTGRGLLVVWLLHPTDSRALSRWLHVQETLCESLHGFGVDNAAADASRVFRFMGSINSKSGGTVHPTYMNGPLAGLHRYQFDEIADALLEFTRAEIREMKARRAVERGEATEAQLYSLDVERAKSGRVIRPPKHLTKRTLWHTRFRDLEAWLAYVYGEDPQLPAGKRDIWILLASTAMSWLTPNRVNIFRSEVIELASRVSDWTAGETNSRMASIFSRHEDSWGGKEKWIEFRGKKWDPRLHYKTSTMIRLLDITEDQMRGAGLRSLVTDEIAREHKTATMRKLRGADEKKAAKAQLQEQARIMHAAGATQQKIAATLGVNQSTVARWLKR